MRINFLLLALVVLFFSQAAISNDQPYLINPGDVLGISVWNEEALQKEVMVLPDGTISFPLVGSINVSSSTSAQVRELIKKKLSRVIPDPEINVVVQSVNGNKIFIIGKVGKPGQIPLIQPTDVMQALSLAGGLTTYAKGENIKIIRRDNGKQKIINFDYNQLTKGKHLSSNIMLKSGDTIVVP